MRRLSGQYFDTHLHPMQIGRQIHEIVEDSLTPVPETDLVWAGAAHSR